MKYATRACQLTGWKQPNCLGTLAAAHAEAGDFDAAITWQEKALEDDGYREKHEEKARFGCGCMPMAGLIGKRRRGERSEGRGREPKGFLTLFPLCGQYNTRDSLGLDPITWND